MARNVTFLSTMPLTAFHKFFIIVPAAAAVQICQWLCWDTKTDCVRLRRGRLDSPGRPAPTKSPTAAVLCSRWNRPANQIVISLVSWNSSLNDSFNYAGALHHNYKLTILYITRWCTVTFDAEILHNKNVVSAHPTRSTVKRYGEYVAGFHTQPSYGNWFI